MCFVFSIQSLSEIGQIFFRLMLQLLEILYLTYKYSHTFKWKKKNVLNDCDQTWEHLPLEAVESPSLEIVRPPLGMTLNSLIGLESWPCSEQEPGPDELWRLLLPNLFQGDQESLFTPPAASWRGRELYTVCTVQ